MQQSLFRFFSNFYSVLVLLWPRFTQTSFEISEETLENNNASFFSEFFLLLLLFKLMRSDISLFYFNVDLPSQLSDEPIKHNRQSSLITGTYLEMRPNSLVMSLPEKADSLISKPLFKDVLCALPSPYKVIVQALKCQCYCNNIVTHKSDGARWVTLEVSLEKLTGSFVKRQHTHRELDVWTWKLSEHRRVRLALRNPSQLLSDTLKKKQQQQQRFC